MTEPRTIEITNRRALGLAVTGSVAAVAGLLVLLLVAMPSPARALGMLCWLGLLAAALAGWCSYLSRFAYDGLGLRRLDDKGWDLPWSAVQSMEILTGRGTSDLMVQANPGPWRPPRGLFAGAGGAPAEAFVMPGLR